jgi:hypothetical protein
MEDSDYELISHGEVDRLKREIDRLKANPFVQSSSEEKLYDALTHLNDSVNKLYGLFESINTQLMKEYQTGNSPEEKIDKILDQNKSIAEALVSFGSRIDSLETVSSEKKVQSSPHPKPREQATIMPEQRPSLSSQNMQSQMQKPSIAPSTQQSQSQYDWDASITSPMQTPQASNTASPRPSMQNVQQRPQPIQQTAQAPQMASQMRTPEFKPQTSMQQPASMQQTQQSQYEQRRMTAPQVPQQHFAPQPSAYSQGQQTQGQQMQSQQIPQIPQVPQYQEDYNTNFNHNGYAQSSFPPPPGGHFAIKPAFESNLDVNYPTPDRFQGANVAPTMEPPIDLVPPEPKKSIFGKLSGIMKGPM